MNIDIENTIIENLIKFIAENDINDPVSKPYHDSYSIKPPPPNRVWKYLMEVFKVTVRNQHLFSCLKDALVKEDYLNVHALKNEISRNHHITEEEILKIGTDQLVELGLGISHSSSLESHHPTLLKLLADWKLNGVNALDTVIISIEEIKHVLYDCDPDMMFEEAADVIVKMKYTHPLLIVAKYHLFFELLRDSKQSH